MFLEVRTMNNSFKLDSDCSIISDLQVKKIILEQVEDEHKLDKKLVKLTRVVNNGENIDFMLPKYGILLYQNSHVSIMMKN